MKGERKTDRSAEAILEYLIGLLEYYLEELNETEEEFFLGEKYAYVECLEIIQEWEKAKALGLNYDIEKRFPIS